MAKWRKFFVYRLLIFFLYPERRPPRDLAHFGHVGVYSRGIAVGDRLLFGVELEFGR